MPDSPRQWTLWVGEFGATYLTQPSSFEKSESVVVVEVSRLREVEAERDEVRAELAELKRGGERWAAELQMAVASRERLEAGLQEAKDTFQEIATYLHLNEGETHNADTCGVDACIFCLAEVRAKEGLERARGVLRKGDK